MHRTIRCMLLIILIVAQVSSLANPSSTLDRACAKWSLASASQLVSQLSSASFSSPSLDTFSSADSNSTKRSTSHLCENCPDVEYFLSIFSFSELDGAWLQAACWSGSWRFLVNFPTFLDGAATFTMTKTNRFHKNKEKNSNIKPYHSQRMILLILYFSVFGTERPTTATHFSWRWFSSWRRFSRCLWPTYRCSLKSTARKANWENLQRKMDNDPAGKSIQTMTSCCPDVCLFCVMTSSCFVVCRRELWRTCRTLLVVIVAFLIFWTPYAVVIAFDHKDRFDLDL